MFINVSWYYRQSLCTRSAKECFDTSSTSLWSFQRMNIQRQYSVILFLTMQDDKAPTTDFVAQTKLQFESTKCSKPWNKFFKFIFYHYTNFNQYLIIYAFDQIFSSSPVSFIRSSTKTKTQITSDFFFSRIRSILVYLMIILNIVEASYQGG
ncbi:Hypothetical_protein [Hexamita inflata]|uniref:Hypothetical_protein n=1 Tax=Hexamita inflata TaxID=28002 RepID=A0AA86V6L3_9EUKA|nr:Hypothetical protein HINF_LOCUS66106 [Hexamita inflata]